MDTNEKGHPKTASKTSSDDPKDQSIINAQATSSYHGNTGNINCEKYQFTPINIEAIAEAAGLAIGILPKAPCLDGISVIMIKQPDKHREYIALINPTDTLDTRYTIALAAAYHLLGYKHSAWIRMDGHALDHQGQFTPDEESAADELATRLLVPGAILKTLAGTMDVPELSRVFQSPESIICRRLIDIGFIPEPRPKEIVAL